MKERRRGTPAAGRGVALIAGAGVLLALSAVPARAAEVSYATECVPPAISGLPPVHGTTKVEITAPATAQVGESVEVVWKFVQAASKNPDLVDLPADSVQPSGVLKVSGAQTADLAMSGPRKNPPIPKGGAMVLPDMKGTLKPTAPGELTLTPDAYTINAMSTDTKCTPEEPVAAAATIKVTAGGSTPAPTPPTTSAPPPKPTPRPSAPASDHKGKEVQVPYACKTPIGDREATSPVQIDARRSGENFDLTVRFKKSVMDSPADIPKDSVKPSMEVVLGGADSGTVHVEGPTNKEDIKAGEPIEIPDLKGTYKPGASGESTLSPGILTIEALGTTTTCTPKRTEVSLTLDTTAQPGGAAGGGGSSTGGSTGGTSAGGSTTGGAATGGGLADTGTDGHGALKALGLVAGTAVLLGAATFTFMPRRR